MKIFVIDASTCLKWVLRDEVDAATAVDILSDFLAHRINLIAPNLWSYEVASGIRSALLQQKIDYSKAKILLELMIQAQPQLLPMESALPQCFTHAHTYNISIYDSMYFTLALENKFPLITADEKLTSQLKKIGKLIIPLKNYPDISL